MCGRGGRAPRRDCEKPFLQTRQELLVALRLLKKIANLDTWSHQIILLMRSDTGVGSEIKCWGSSPLFQRYFVAVEISILKSIPGTAVSFMDWQPQSFFSLAKLDLNHKVHHNMEAHDPRGGHSDSITTAFTGAVVVLGTFCSSHCSKLECLLWISNQTKAVFLCGVQGLWILFCLLFHSMLLFRHSNLSDCASQELPQ